VRASFDGVTDLPICAIVPGVKSLKPTKLFSAPSFGKFIHVTATYIDIDKHAIIYYPTGNIEYIKERTHQGIIIDGKPAVCCQTIDSKYIIINSDGEIIETETVYATVKYIDDYKVGNGTLRLIHRLAMWEYTTNPALKTKPAAPSE
jgi:hypothetical protein